MAWTEISCPVSLTDHNNPAPVDKSRTDLVPTAIPAFLTTVGEGPAPDSNVHVPEAVQPKLFWPSGPPVRKNICPTLQPDGSMVPVVNGLVD
jgi:hypothetical protein